LGTGVVSLFRTELGNEVASGFPRLTRIPQTDIIWLLDYVSALSAPECDALLDDLAEFAAAAFPPVFPQVPRVGPALAQMDEARRRPGSRGGTRYTDIKMLRADPSLRDPNAYHSSWREFLTSLHFQPRPDLLPTLDDLAPAKAPLVRKLVNRGLTRTLGLKTEKLQGGASKCTGSVLDREITVRVDFGGMLSQLGYSVTFKNPGDQTFVFVQLSYERLWATSGRWDYLTEENAARSIDFFVDQVAYLADLGVRVAARLRE
jgi:hypothetical protein